MLSVEGHGGAVQERAILHTHHEARRQESRVLLREKLSRTGRRCLLQLVRRSLEKGCFILVVIVSLHLLRVCFKFP